MLRFQAEPAAVGIDLSAFTRARRFHHVARIELHPRLGCQNLQHSPAARLGDAGCQLQRARRAVEHKVMIVAAPYPDLLVIRSDARTDCGGLAKVERRSGHVAQMRPWGASSCPSA